APAALALQHGQSSLSYGALDGRANRVARYLARHGAGADVPVAVCTERGLEMVVALLGILKAGAAYVPLDPESPGERRAFVLSDAQAPVLLTQARLRGRLPGYSGRVVCLDADWGEIEGEAPTSPQAAASPSDLAYVIYTSGSTGQPKGVAVTHASLCNLVHWHQRAYE